MSGDVVLRHEIGVAPAHQIWVSQQTRFIDEPENICQVYAERALGSLPTMLKWSWCPFSFAMKTTPIL